MLKNKFTYIKVFVLFLFFLTLIIGSEVIYLAKNRPQALGAYYLYPAKWFASQGNSEKSLYFVKKAITIPTYLNSINDNGVALSGNLPSLKITKPSFNNKYLEVMLELDPYSVIGFNGTDLSKTLYQLAGIAYSEMDFNLASDFLTFATYINPELSHYHVELANLYLTLGNSNLALETLTRCQNFNYPKTHCKQFDESNFRFNTPEKFGFLKDALEKHYQSTRILYY